MGSAVFKTVSRALVPFWVGSIPMHLRQPLLLLADSRPQLEASSVSPQNLPMSCPELICQP